MEDIPKSQEFERGIDFEHKARYDTLNFPSNANEHFVYSTMEELLNNRHDLSEMIRDFMESQKRRIDILDGYSRGENHTIRQGRRRLDEDKADQRISHNWGGYISNFITGFMASIPIDVTVDDQEASQTEIGHQNEAIESIHSFNDINNLNHELAFDASRHGRAFEYHYRKKIGDQFYDAIKLIDPSEMFVIRDKTVEKNVIGAVHVPIYNQQLEVTVFTDKEAITFKPTDEFLPELIEDSRREHFYNDVPVVEWWNNRFREGDWENEISLFDAYDAAQSDTANYMSDLNDATLVIKGDIEGSGLSAEDAFLMNKANTFLLESGTTADGKQTSVDAEYIYKQYDVQGTEAYKDRLLNDIYKLTNVPNIDDDKFGSQSGIAIQYKLIGLQQIKATKETFYKKALAKRYQLIASVHKELNDTEFNPFALTFTFHENLPQDIWEEINQFINAGGQVSQETLTEQTSFTDHQQEQARIEQEEQERMAPFMDDRNLGDDDANLQEP